MSLAVGPLGRNAEGMGAVNTKGKVAAMCALQLRLPSAVSPLATTQAGSDHLPLATALDIRYSYSKTKGLFGGVSVEGSVIVERQEYVTLGSPRSILHSDSLPPHLLECSPVSL